MFNLYLHSFGSGCTVPSMAREVTPGKLLLSLLILPLYPVLAILAGLIAGFLYVSEFFAEDPNPANRKPLAIRAKIGALKVLALSCWTFVAIEVFIYAFMPYYLHRWTRHMSWWGEILIYPLTAALAGLIFFINAQKIEKQYSPIEWAREIVEEHKSTASSASQKEPAGRPAPRASACR